MKRVALLVSALVMGLTACGEKPQTATARKVDDKPWSATQTPHMVTGFKAGDQGAWEQQLKARAQSQNEYNRTGAR
jgi:hypothetical protein